MKPQSAAFLGKARELLEQAETVLRVGYADAAGRTAYLAGFHAAQALIFEREDRAFKSHKGV
ncbi:HEPN domain-containing protein [Roseiarcus fermentans]|uniref:HEPN domain-containing protein n=1 Tax=Roseiarcus fermentans TaxID=1473586 RepID=UPI001AECB7F9|nr:HEPN domain-containing protein [Roseiarcus fermentans]